jgi:hypothetical protein
MKTPEQRIRESIARNGKKDPETIRSTLKKGGPVPLPMIRAILAGTSIPKASDAPAANPASDSVKKVKGISLQNARVSDRRPQDGIKLKIHQLRKGQGYPVDELANEWCVGADTIRNHAKALGSLKYVEASQGQWVQCVLHPDTAKDF